MCRLPCSDTLPTFLVHSKYLNSNSFSPFSPRSRYLFPSLFATDWLLLRLLYTHLPQLFIRKKSLIETSTRYPYSFQSPHLPQHALSSTMKFSTATIGALAAAMTLLVRGPALRHFAGVPMIVLFADRFAQFAFCTCSRPLSLQALTNDPSLVVNTTLVSPHLLRPRSSVVIPLAFVVSNVMTGPCAASGAAPATMPPALCIPRRR